ncbi:MAG: HAMP domain-containing protein, partial [Anaerolineae bacterium]|nr:HAMP domain-containing protein [Anaerolineae bacterium]
FKSLRTRLTVLFVTLTIIPLLIVGALISQRGFEALQNQAVDLQSYRAQQVATKLGDFFSERQNELHVLTAVYGLDLLNPSAQYDVLAALLADQQAYYELTLLDASGQERVRVRRGEITTPDSLTNRGDNPVFQAALETGQVSYSPVYFNAIARDRLITMAVPMVDLFTGEIAHVLVSEIRFLNIEEKVLREANLASGEDIFVIDSAGVIIAHRNPNLVIKETVFDAPGSNGRHQGLSFEDAILAMFPVQLGSIEFLVVAETVYTNATALAFDLTNLSAIVTGITLLVAIVVVAFVVSRVVNPIARLSRVAKAIQDGDFSKRADVTGQDEIGQFAIAFNAMSDAIQKREADLVDQANALRIATARAKEAARVKGEFLANVSHEL